MLLEAIRVNVAVLHAAFLALSRSWYGGRGVGSGPAVGHPRPDQTRACWRTS